ncbi:hypothetical protein LUQ84_002396 [Hamiltosporidium tvaerminnensis]|nr:hypothetical protein LUQ84_002396 [Hamiltosporidium tvaerminnensis]
MCINFSSEKVVAFYFLINYEESCSSPIIKKIRTECLCLIKRNMDNEIAEKGLTRKIFIKQETGQYDTCAILFMDRIGLNFEIF